MQPVFKEQGGQGSRDVATIPNELATQAPNHLRNRGAIIDIAWSQATREQLAAIVDRQVQLEAIKPPHRRFAALGIQSKHAMLGILLGSQTESEVESMKLMPVQAP